MRRPAAVTYARVWRTPARLAGKLWLAYDTGGDAGALMTSAKTVGRVWMPSTTTSVSPAASNAACNAETDENMPRVSVPAAAAAADAEPTAMA